MFRATPQAIVMARFLTLELKRPVSRRMFEKGERLRLRADGDAGRAYLDAKARGAKTFRFAEGVDIPVGGVQVVYEGDDAAEAARPSIVDMAGD